MARTRQPQGARINFQSEFAQGIRACFTGIDPALELVNGIRFLASGSPSRSVSLNGVVAVTATNAAAYDGWYAPEQTSGSQSDRLYNVAAPPLTAFIVGNSSNQNLGCGIGRCNGSTNPAWAVGFWAGSSKGAYGSSCVNGVDWLYQVAPSVYIETTVGYHTAVLVVSTATTTVYCDGIADQTGATGSGNFEQQYSDKYRCLSVGGGYKFAGGNFAVAGMVRGAWSPDMVREFHRNPWQIFAAPRRVWVQLGAASGGAGATGTSAATLGGVTGTAAGTIAIAATSAATLGAVTGTAAGAAAIAGTSAQSLAETTGTAAATLAIAATSAATLAATTGTAAGTLAIAATSAQTVGAVTGTATGTTLGAATGTSAATLSDTTGTAAGMLALAATSAATIGIVTGTSVGTISIGGASAQALNDVTGVAVGNTTGVTNGVSIVTLDSVSGSAAGYADILATAFGTLEAISGAAAGAISIVGVSAETLADVICGVPPPTLPLEVPTSSRTLAAAVIRLGASPLAAESPRLGTTPVRKAPPRLG